MATRKPLFFSSDYSPEEMATSDDMTVGKVTLTGVGGVALDGGGFRAINFADPTADQDLATKAYVDAVAAGLDIKASVRVKTVGDYSTWTAAGSGVGATLTSPSNATSNNIFDGVTVALNDRVLVTSHGANDTTPDTENGIYKVTQLANGTSLPTILTRATDFDGTPSGEVTAGAFTFVTEGTTSADQGWVLVTDDPITVDTTALMFSQFSASYQYTFDQGLLQSGASVKVDLDTTANAQGAGAGGGSSGLEFDVNTASGKLRAAVNGTGGIERTASGLAVKIDDTPDTLDSGSNGLKVVGLPSLFKINGTAVGATVTAPNLDTLTNGSNADALHVHASTPATEAPKVENTLAVNEAIAVADPIYQTATNDRIGKADTDTDAKAAVLGITRTAQATVGQTAEIVSVGPAAGILSGATAGARYYLATGGGISTSAPGAGKKVVEVGFAMNATDLFVRIIDRGRKAA